MEAARSPSFDPGRDCSWSKDREAALSGIPLFGDLLLDRCAVLRYSRLLVLFAGLGLEDAIDQMIDGGLFAAMPPATGLSVEDLFIRDSSPLPFVGQIGESNGSQVS